MVWRRMNKNICSRESIFLREGIYGDFIPFFHRYGVSFQSYPLFYIMPYEGLCVYDWMSPMTASRKLISILSNLICSDTKRIDKIVCFEKQMLTRYAKQEKSICHWIEVNHFFIFESMCIYCAFIMNSNHRKSKKKCQIWCTSGEN